MAAPRTGALTNLVGVSASSGIKPLGFMTWFTVPDASVPITRVRRAWIQHDLDPRVLPPEPRPLYLFKRAMKAQQGRVKHDDGTVTETDVKPVMENAESCVYQISRVTRDEAQRVVNYPKAMRVVFNKSDSRLDFQPFSAETGMHELIPMQAAIEAFYDGNSKTISGRVIRGIVRDYIKTAPYKPKDPNGTVGLAGENMRGKSGGIYFVRAEFQKELMALAGAVHDLHPDGSAYLYLLPVADGESEKEMVRREYSKNIVKDMEEAFREAGVLLRDDRKQSIRNDHVAHHWRKLAILRARAQDTRQIVGSVDKEIKEWDELLEARLKELPSVPVAA